jgi:hypothetical protein
MDLVASYSLIAITGVVLLLGLFFVYQAYIYRKNQRKLLHELSQEADKLLQRMKTNRKLQSSAENEGEHVDGADKLLSSAKYLTTLVTVLVQKAGGTVRLKETDFLDIANEEYVSVYVDVRDSSILLHLNTSEFPAPGDVDDDATYH